MAAPVSTIRNLGPASDQAFAKAGIHTAEELRALGPDDAYLRLLNAGTRPHFIGYYAMVMGLQGRPWNDLGPEEKVQLRARFDAIKAKAAVPKEKGRTQLDAALREIGVLGPDEGQPTSSSPEKK